MENKGNTPTKKGQQLPSTAAIPTSDPNWIAGYPPMGGGNAPTKKISPAPLPNGMNTTLSATNSTRVDATTPRWMQLLGSAGVHGKAVVALAPVIADRRKISLLDAVELADDLLTGETLKMLEAVVTLASDGWDLSLGELLSCARKL